MWILIILAVISLAISLSVIPSLRPGLENEDRRWAALAREMQTAHNTAAAMLQDEEVSHGGSARPYAILADSGILFSGKLTPNTSISVGGGTTTFSAEFTKATGLTGGLNLSGIQMHTDIAPPAAAGQPATRYLITYLPPSSPGRPEFSTEARTSTAWLEQIRGSMTAGFLEGVNISPGRTLAIIPDGAPQPSSYSYFAPQNRTQATVQLPPVLRGKVPDGSFIYMTGWTLPED